MAWPDLYFEFQYGHYAILNYDKRMQFYKIWIMNYKITKMALASNMLLWIEEENADVHLGNIKHLWSITMCMFTY